MAARIDPDIPDLVSVTEIAERLAVSRQAVLKMISSGRLPARQAGTTWVVRREVAEQLTVSQEDPAAR
jgi:excisionase family DNA binding protein